MASVYPEVKWTEVMDPERFEGQCASMALCYARGNVPGAPAEAVNAFNAMLHSAAEIMGRDRYHQMVKKGLTTLVEIGFIRVAKDGQGDWVPVAVDEKRIEESVARDPKAKVSMVAGPAPGLIISGERH